VSLSVSLLIETSQRAGVVALATDAGVVAAMPLDDARRHARDLAVAVDALLKSQSITPRNITRVVVGTGPGSYTGLRVGLMSAKAFAYAVGADIIAVPTFHAIAQRVSPLGGSVDVIADALQGQVYHQRFVAGEATTALAIATLSEWLATTPTAVTGPGVGIHESLIPDSIVRCDASLRLPTADSLWRASLNITAVSRADLFALEPLYLRGSSAEEKRRRDAAAAVN
jgi:tRNA threonylcarbamoyladenosine biosynthesis protein TsaB